MIELQLRVFLLQGLRHDLSPQPRARQDVGFIDGMDLQMRVGGKGNLGRDPGDTLDFRDGVDHRIPSDAVLPIARGRYGFFTFPEVQATDELANDDEVGAFRDLGFEWGGGEEGVGCEGCGSDVGVEPE